MQRSAEGLVVRRTHGYAVSAAANTAGARSLKTSQPVPGLVVQPVPAVRIQSYNLLARRRTGTHGHPRPNPRHEQRR